MKTYRLILAVALAVTATSRGDQWPVPVLRVILSPDSNALLRVVPGTKENPHALATVLRFDPSSGNYRRIAKFTLRNPTAPHAAVITNDARYVVTFDDWYEVGRTENAVVVYRGTGELVKLWSLKEIFSEEERKTFQSSISSIWWRGEVEVSEAPGSPPMVVIQLGREGAPLRKGRNAGYPIYLDLGSLTFKK